MRSLVLDLEILEGGMGNCALYQNQGNRTTLLFIINILKENREYHITCFHDESITTN